MERQEIHEKIVEFLNSLKDSDGNKAFDLKTYSKLRTGEEYRKTREYQEVSKMTPVVCSVFNIMSGSAGDIDFYRLFQAYLLDEEKRKLINQII
jgi:hypothetical protein